MRIDRRAGLKLVAVIAAGTVGNQIEAQDTRTGLITFTGFQLSLDQFEKFVVLRGKETIEITSQELWDALKKESK